MTWEQIAANHKPRTPSRFERIVNGDVDHINGYDDGEWLASERPPNYYIEAERFDELVALEGTNIY